MKKFDTYSLKARVYPTVIVLFPCFLLSMIYITNIEAYYHYCTSFAAFGLFSFVLAQIGRDNGKKKENELFASWGGKPTSVILRHTNDYLDIHTKRRFHVKLEQTISGIKIPTREEEQEDLQEADAIYDSCTHYLISKTRNTDKYALLFIEFTNYGFRRNLWGMKVWALLIVGACMVIHSLMSTERFTSIEIIDTKDCILFVIFMVFTLFWLLIVNRDWVKIPAFAYAERLYEALNEQI